MRKFRSDMRTKAMQLEPDTDETKRDRTAALALTAESAVMTLAVTTAEGPWAAPVYYVFLPADAGFYFFSSPESRHIRAALEGGACGAAIFRPAHALGTDALEPHSQEPHSQEPTSWETICGLQMRGKLTTAGVTRGPRALALYLKKFPFSRSLLPTGKDRIKIFQHHLGVRFYRFSAVQVEWTDNRIRFGYRKEITLG